MSVLIKGMEMPKNCCGCYFSVHDFCDLWKIRGEAKEAEDWFTERPEYCLLTEVLTADEIEELKTYKSAFKTILQVGGWWLVGNDKAIHSVEVPIDWPPKGAKILTFPGLQGPEEGE